MNGGAFFYSLGGQGNLWRAQWLHQNFPQRLLDLSWQEAAQRLLHKLLLRNMKLLCLLALGIAQLTPCLFTFRKMKFAPWKIRLPEGSDPETKPQGANFCHIWLRGLAEQAEAARCYCSPNNKFYLSIFSLKGNAFSVLSQKLGSRAKIHLYIKRRCRSNRLLLSAKIHLSANKSPSYPPK